MAVMTTYSGIASSIPLSLSYHCAATSSKGLLLSRVRGSSLSPSSTRLSLLVVMALVVPEPVSSIIARGQVGASRSFWTFKSSCAVTLSDLVSSNQQHTHQLRGRTHARTHTRSLVETTTTSSLKSAHLQTPDTHRPLVRTAPNHGYSTRSQVSRTDAGGRIESRVTSYHGDAVGQSTRQTRNPVLYSVNTSFALSPSILLLARPMPSSETLTPPALRHPSPSSSSFSRHARRSPSFFPPLLRLVSPTHQKKRMTSLAHRSHPRRRSPAGSSTIRRFATNGL